MKAKDNLYNIGDWVSISGCQQRVAEGPIGHSVAWVPHLYKSPRVGQICGMARRCEGKVVSPVMRYAEDYGPNYFVVSKVHLFYEVRFGWLNRPVLVTKEQMDWAMGGELPLLSIRQLPWSDANKRELREIMKDWPRDEKGRWRKETV